MTGYFFSHNDFTDLRKQSFGRDLHRFINAGKCSYFFLRRNLVILKVPQASKFISLNKHSTLNCTRRIPYCASFTDKLTTD